MKTMMRRLLGIGLAAFWLGSGAATPPPPLPAGTRPATTADHTQFAALKGPFKSGPEVTKACLSCHNQAAH